MAISNRIPFCDFLRWVHASPELWAAIRAYVQQKPTRAVNELAQRTEKLIDYLGRRSTEPDPADPVPNSYREFETLSGIPYTSIYLLGVPPCSASVPELVKEIKPYFGYATTVVDNFVCNIAVVDAYRELNARKQSSYARPETLLNSQSYPVRDDHLYPQPVKTVPRDDQLYPQHVIIAPRVSIKSTDESPSAGASKLVSKRTFASPLALANGRKTILSKGKERRKRPTGVCVRCRMRKIKCSFTLAEAIDSCDHCHHSGLICCRQPVNYRQEFCVRCRERKIRCSFTSDGGIDSCDHCNYSGSICRRLPVDDRRRTITEQASLGGSSSQLNAHLATNNSHTFQPSQYSIGPSEGLPTWNQGPQTSYQETWTATAPEGWSPGPQISYQETWTAPNPGGWSWRPQTSYQDTWTTLNPGVSWKTPTSEVWDNGPQPSGQESWMIPDPRIVELGTATP